MVSAGLGRSRNVAHSLLSAFCVIAVAVLVYSVAGRVWPGGAERELATSEPLLTMFSLFAVAVAAIIPLGAAAERSRLSACCASTALFAGITYPLFAHWVWGDGWLARLFAAHEA